MSQKIKNKKVNKTDRRIKNLMHKDNLLMLKEHKLWMANKKNKNKTINHLNKILEDSGKNQNNLNNSNLLKTRQINSPLKINFSLQLSPI